MCIVRQPKIAPISAPSAPPPPVDTAGGVVESAASRASTNRSTKRRGLKALTIAPVSGLNTSAAGTGLST